MTWDPTSRARPGWAAAALLALGACGDAEVELSVSGGPLVRLDEGVPRALTVEGLGDLEAASLEVEPALFDLATLTPGAAGGPPTLTLQARCEAVLAGAVARVTHVTIRRGDGATASLGVQIAARTDGACAPDVGVWLAADCADLATRSDARPARYPLDDAPRALCVSVDPRDGDEPYTLTAFATLPASALPTPSAETTAVRPALALPMVPVPSVRGRFEVRVTAGRPGASGPLVDEVVAIEAGAPGDVAIEVHAPAEAVPEFGVISLPVQVWSYPAMPTPCLRAAEQWPAIVGDRRDEKAALQVRCVGELAGAPTQRACASGEFIVDVSPRSDAPRAQTLALWAGATADDPGCAAPAVDAAPMAVVTLPTTNVADDVALAGTPTQLACTASGDGVLALAAGEITPQAVQLTPTSAGAVPLPPLRVDDQPPASALAVDGGFLIESGGALRLATLAPAADAWQLTSVATLPGDSWTLAAAARARVDGAAGAARGPLLLAPRAGALALACLEPAACGAARPVPLELMPWPAGSALAVAPVGPDASATDDLVVVLEPGGDVTLVDLAADLASAEITTHPALLAPGPWRIAAIAHPRPSADDSPGMIVAVADGRGTAVLLSGCTAAGCRVRELPLVGGATAVAATDDARALVGSPTGVFRLDQLDAGGGGTWTALDPLAREHAGDDLPLYDPRFGTDLTACIGAPHLAYIVERDGGDARLRVADVTAPVAGPWPPAR